MSLKAPTLSRSPSDCRMRPQKTVKMNHGGDGGGNSLTTIEDLDDHILTQILFKLPSCAPIVACKPVNKRWCSLISDIRFGAHFSNHKKKTTSLSYSDWTFLAMLRKFNPPWYRYILGTAASANDAVFGSSKFLLGFLPCANLFIETTFMDLVLCSSAETWEDGDLIYYITNPVTKQWVALPPCPRIINQWGVKPWVALVCRPPYTQDYQFRVVVLEQTLPPVYKLAVYCSEIGEWKKFNLSVWINPELVAQKSHYNNRFQAVVCNGIIYLHHKLFFAAFNPFDVDETTDTNTTIQAKVLPSLLVNADLLVSSGHLFIMYTPKREGGFVCYKQDGSAIELTLIVWKLDLDQVPLIWKKTFEGTCTGNVNGIEPLHDDIHPDCDIADIGMHPNNDNLLYMHLFTKEQFVLCDTRSRLIKPLKSLPGYNIMLFHRFELQWWPTSVPRAYLPNASQ